MTLSRRKRSPSTSPLAVAKREAKAFCTLAGISVEPHRVRFGFDLLHVQPTGVMRINLMLIHIYKTVV